MIFIEKKLEARKIDASKHEPVRPRRSFTGELNAPILSW